MKKREWKWLTVAAALGMLCIAVAACNRKEVADVEEEIVISDDGEALGDGAEEGDVEEVVSSVLPAPAPAEPSQDAAAASSNEETIVEMPETVTEETPAEPAPEVAEAPATQTGGSEVVRVTIRFREGVSVDAGLAALQQEVLDGAEVDLYRRDDENGEVNIALSADKVELLENCSVVETSRVLLPQNMH